MVAKKRATTDKKPVRKSAVSKSPAKKRSTTDKKPVRKRRSKTPSPANKELISQMGDVKDTPKQEGKITCLPPKTPAKSLESTRKAIKKLLLNHRPDDIVNACLETMSWEQFLMCVANICTNRSIELRYREPKTKEQAELAKEWKDRAYLFHGEIPKGFLPSSLLPLSRD